MIIPIGSSRRIYEFAQPTAANANLELRTRMTTVNIDSITFGPGTTKVIATNAIGENNDYIIPTKIYGVKN